MGALIEALQSGVVLASFALAGFALIVLTLVKHRRRVDRADSGLVLSGILSGLAIPRGLYIASYLVVPDPPAVHTRLHGYEAEIFAAGLLLAFTALGTMLSLREEASKQPYVAVAA